MTHSPNVEARIAHVLSTATDAKLAKWRIERLEDMYLADSKHLADHYASELARIDGEITRRAAVKQREQNLIGALLCAACLLLGFSIGLYYARSTCQQIEVTR